MSCVLWVLWPIEEYNFALSKGPGWYSQRYLGAYFDLCTDSDGHAKSLGMTNQPCTKCQSDLSSSWEDTQLSNSSDELCATCFEEVVQMLRKVETELRTRGKVSLPSLHRHVILDGWLKPTVGQVGYLPGFANQLHFGSHHERINMESVQSVTRESRSNFETILKTYQSKTRLYNVWHNVTHARETFWGLKIFLSSETRLKMLYGQVLQSRMDKLFENISQERLWWMHGFARKVSESMWKW